jgi:hypothetical protein
MPSERRGADARGLSAAPPYWAQWASPGLIPEFLAGRHACTDPAWAESGAASVEEYARWAEHLCGTACLRMALAARGVAAPSMHELRRAVQAEGGYVEEPDGTIRGLIYAGAVAWLRRAHGIEARVVLDLPAADIPKLVEDGSLFIASVHPAIRSPDRQAPGRGGHLVLVFAAADSALRFHNPSGDTPATQVDARLAIADFDRFFAGRGIHIP